MSAWMGNWVCEAGWRRRMQGGRGLGGRGAVNFRRRRSPRRLCAAAIARSLRPPAVSAAEGGGASRLRRKPFPQWHCAVSSHQPRPSGQAPTTGAQPASPQHGSSRARPQAACRSGCFQYPLVCCPPTGRPTDQWVLKIRSEVSAPARLWPRSVDAIGGALVPDGSWFGRAGKRTKAILYVGRVKPRRALPAPAKEP